MRAQSRRRPGRDAAALGLALGIAALGLPLAAGLASADGGAVVASGAAGPFAVTVLASPAPLRAGPSQWSVLVQAPADGRIAIDASVEIEARSDAAPAARERATRERSDNRLLYTAWLSLPEAGPREMAVRVRDGAREAVFAFQVTLGPRQDRLAGHWRALAVAPLALALFGLHQWLVLGRARARG